MLGYLIIAYMIFSTGILLYKGVLAANRTQVVLFLHVLNVCPGYSHNNVVLPFISVKTNGVVGQLGVLLPPLPKCQDSKCISPRLISTALGIELKPGLPAY